jgi:hypothetical protein
MFRLFRASARALEAAHERARSSLAMSAGTPERSTNALKYQHNRRTNAWNVRNPLTRRRRAKSGPFPACRQRVGAGDERARSGPDRRREAAEGQAESGRTGAASPHLPACVIEANALAKPEIMALDI